MLLLIAGIIQLVMGVLLVVGLVAVLYAVNAVQTSHPCTIHAHMHTCTCSRPRTPCTRSTMTVTTPSRYAPPTPAHSRIQLNTSAPDLYPLPLPSYNPLATHPNPEHAVTHLDSLYTQSTRLHLNPILSL